MLQVGVITEGELILTTDEETKKFAVGEWYHVQANAEHSAEFEVDSAIIEFWFTSVTLDSNGRCPKS